MEGILCKEVHFTLSVTKCVHWKTESTSSPPKSFTVFSPFLSISPVNITLGLSFSGGGGEVCPGVCLEVWPLLPLPLAEVLEGDGV